MPDQSRTTERGGRHAVPVAVQRFADAGPGCWWFVHHPDGFLIECGAEGRAQQIAREINAGRLNNEPASSAPTLLTLRQFLRAVADHPAKDDQALREILRDLSEHAERLHAELQDG